MISQMQPISRWAFLLALASLIMMDSFVVDAFASIHQTSTQESAVATAMMTTNPRHRRRVARTRTCQWMAAKNDKDEAQNEWGVPLSSTLPPLVKKPSSSSSRRLEHLPNGGHVTLLGSGPGDPDLLTVTAHRMLTEADPETTLVVADRLVSPEILELINCPYQVARKLPGCADLAQEEIYWWCYQALNQGKHVIRLKIGDPFVFGRGGEEVLTFREFGVEPKVVPVRVVFVVGFYHVWFWSSSCWFVLTHWHGFEQIQGVSAAFSAPLLGNIPVTHRGCSNQVVMCTGYGREGTSPDLIQYHKEQTVVFLMAVGRLRELSQRLQTLAHYPAE